jgi:predicted ester cyclase
LDTAPHFVDLAPYWENCVGFTRGFLGWNHAKASLGEVWKGLPNLQVELHNLIAAKDVALARGMVRGTATGRLYSAPATKRSFEASFFDYVRVENGLIVERVQQADVLGQMRQLYGKGVGLVGLGAMLWRLKPSAHNDPGRRLQHLGHIPTGEHVRGSDQGNAVEHVHDDEGSQRM